MSEIVCHFFCRKKLLLGQRIFFEKLTGDVTLLPLMPLFKWFPACGVVSSSTLGGKDIVVAGGNDANTVLIYNTETNAWRPGPFLPREIESVSVVQFVRSNIITSSSLRKKPIFLSKITFGMPRECV